MRVKYTSLILALLLLLAWGCPGGPPFLQAIKAGDSKRVKHYLDEGIDPNKQDPEGKTFLMIAVEENQYYVVTTLLEYGGDPEIKDKRGMTSLMAAAQNGNRRIIKALLDAGANVIAEQTGKGKTAADFADEAGHSEVVNMLKGGGK